MVLLFSTMILEDGRMVVGYVYLSDRGNQLPLVLKMTRLLEARDGESTLEDVVVCRRIWWSVFEGNTRRLRGVVRDVGGSLE